LCLSTVLEKWLRFCPGRTCIEFATIYPTVTNVSLWWGMWIKDEDLGNGGGSGCMGEGLGHLFLTNFALNLK
jgi:hypothetical protein